MVPRACTTLRDGRYALQAFPPPEGEAGEEFYLAGVAERVQDLALCQVVLDETGVRVEMSEVLFELWLERAMFTYLVAEGTPAEHPVHSIWLAPRSHGTSGDPNRPPEAKSPGRD